MDIKIKALIAIAPFGIAIAVGAVLAMPAYNDYSAKNEQTDGKKVELEELQAKLVNKSKVQKEKLDIEQSILALRSSVPKKPQLELLNLDIDKMCTESGIDLIAFKEPDKETLTKAGLLDDGAAASAAKDRLKGAVRTAQAASAGQAAAVAGTPGAAGAAKAGATPETGLAKITVQVKGIGDYAGLTQLVKKLETYQRVVAISELKASVPKQIKIDADTKSVKKAELPDEMAPTESDPQGDYKKLNISFLLTAYYLP